MTHLAVGLVLLSALLHAGWNTATKGSVAPATFLVSMEGIVLLVLLPLTLLSVDLSGVPPRLWLLVGASGVVHGVYGFWLVRSYEEDDLSLVYPIARSTPAFVPFVAVPLFGESLTVQGGIGIALVVTSIWLVQTGGGLHLRRLREVSVFPYLTLLSTVGYSLLDKGAMERFDAVAWPGTLPRAVVYFVLLEAIYLPLMALLVRRRLTAESIRLVWRREWWRLLVGAAGATLSYTLILEALRSSAVSYVVAVRQTSVLFALVLGILLLGERPSAARILGILGTVAGVALIAFAAPA